MFSCGNPPKKKNSVYFYFITAMEELVNMCVFVCEIDIDVDKDINVELDI